MNLWLFLYRIITFIGFQKAFFEIKFNLNNGFFANLQVTLKEIKSNGKENFITN